MAILKPATLNRLLYILLMLCCINTFAQDTVRVDSVKEVHGADSPTRQSVVSYIPPAVFALYGGLSLTVKGIRQIDYNVYNDMQEDHPGFKTKADNYLQFLPAAAVYGLNLAGVHGKHNFADRTALYVLSQSIFVGSTFVIKHYAGRTRPSERDRLSFPSGHTGNAFASAEFLFQEYGDVSPWYGIAGYAVASTTGILRVYNNAHWFSDVVAGAGVGILSTKLAYLLYPVIKRQFGSGKNNRTGFVILPTYQDGTVGFSMSLNP